MESARHKDRVNTVDAKNNLNSLLAQVKSRKKPVIIEKRGEPVAVLVDYETYRTSQKKGQVSGARKVYEELYADHLTQKGNRPMGTDSAEIIRQARDERIKRLNGG